MLSSHVKRTPIKAAVPCAPQILAAFSGYSDVKAPPVNPYAIAKKKSTPELLVFVQMRKTAIEQSQMFRSQVFIAPNLSDDDRQMSANSRGRSNAPAMNPMNIRPTALQAFITPMMIAEVEVGTPIEAPYKGM